MVVRSVAIALIVIGAFMLLYNGYQWWDQIRVAVHDPELAMSIADNWDDRNWQKPLKQGVDTDWKPEIGEEIGQLIIPRIGAILPIIEGTDEEELAKGVGHYVGWGTVLPGETGHAVLSGHRDTVFRRAGELKDGDRLYGDEGRERLHLSDSQALDHPRGGPDGDCAQKGADFDADHLLSLRLRRECAGPLHHPVRTDRGAHTRGESTPQIEDGVL